MIQKNPLVQLVSVAVMGHLLVAAFSLASAEAQQQQQHQQPSELIRNRRQASPAGKPAESGTNFLSMLSELGPQVERAKMFSSVFNSLSPSSSPNNAPASPLSANQQASNSPGQLMSSLSELIRSTQDRNAKAVADTQQSVQQAAQQAQQQTAQAAQSAQGGIQAALTEIGQGLQRIATNNPSLLPDVKNLYQSVSSKLSTASTSVVQAAPTSSAIMPATNSEQLADNLAKMALPGLQTPA